MARKVNKRLAICSFLIAAGLLVVVLGVFSGVTGKEAQNLPKAIESVEPPVGAAQVPNQSRIFVDLVAGYTGELIVDGTLLQTISEDDLRNVAPGEQGKEAFTTVYAAGNATLTFQPKPGAPIETLTEGVHEVTVQYWPLVNPSQASAFTWKFNVV